MWMLLGILGALTFLAGVVACIFFVFKRDWSKVKRLALAAVGGFVLFFVGVLNDSDNVETNVQAPLTFEEEVRNAIISVVKEKTNNDRESISDLEISNNDKVIIVKLNTGDHLTVNTAKSSMLLDSVKIFEKIYSLGDLEQVRIVWIAPLLDVYGNEHDTEVIDIILNKESANKINWSNFDRDNLHMVADVWIHRVFEN